MEERNEDVCGIEQEIHYDNKIKRLNFELKRVYLGEDDKEGFFVIEIEDWKKNGKCKRLCRLHIKEALEIKSIIDQLVYDALQQPDAIF